MSSFPRLLKVELKLSLRNMDGLLFGIIMPIIILVISGLVNRNLVRENFGAYISVGICALGLMSLPLTLSGYREKGILKRLQVTPLSPSILLGIQIIVQTIMVLVSALLTTLAAMVFFGYRINGNWVLQIAAFFLVLVSIFSIGLLITSRAKDYKRAGLICSAVYFPMLLFSGTTIPSSIFPEILQKVIWILPLRHGITLLNGLSQGTNINNFLPEIVILVIIPLISIPISIKSFKWHN